jgi:hypothetical protein
MPLDFDPFRDSIAVSTCQWLKDYQAIVPGVGLIEIKVMNDEQAKLACPTAEIITRTAYFNLGVEKSEQDYLMSLDSDIGGGPHNEQYWTKKQVYVALRLAGECLNGDRQ